MIGDKSVLALIPARGGSKGVPRKNIRPAGGKPLIAWTIEAAKCSRYIDRLILSSDDQAITAVAKACGCDVPSMRPAELATDKADSMARCGARCKRSATLRVPIVLLQPTSPMRNADDIDAAMERCAQTGMDRPVSAFVSRTRVPIG